MARGGGGGGGGSSSRSNNYHNENENDGGDARCPLSFRLGSTQHASHHFGGSSSHENAVARSPPIIYPLHPDLDAGSGRQILLATAWEMLEMWTPGGGGSGGGIGIGGSSSSSSSEQLKEDEQFPLIFEGSSFHHSAPLVHDVSGDGIMDAILGDYDGDLHLVGLDFEHDVIRHTGGGGDKNNENGGSNENYRRRRRRRYYERISVPRLSVRKSWYDAAIGRTVGINDDNATSKVSSGPTSDPNRTRQEFFEPYHAFFEQANKDWRMESHGEDGQKPLRGVSADVLTMGMDSAKALMERRRRRDSRRRDSEFSPANSKEGVMKNSEENGEDANFKVRDEEGHAKEGNHRRLQEEAAILSSEADVHHQDEREEVVRNEDGTQNVVGGNHAIVELEAEDTTLEEIYHDDGLFHDDASDAPPDGTESMEDMDFASEWGDGKGEEFGDSLSAGDEIGYRSMDDYFPYGDHGYADDGYKAQVPDGWDSYGQYQEAKDAYYHDSNYLHLPPHLLSTCALVELPREYVTESMKPADLIDELILCAVSYYFDEDEERAGMKMSFGKHANANGGDETEEQRGRYVANAILGYNLK